MTKSVKSPSSSCRDTGPPLRSAGLALTFQTQQGSARFCASLKTADQRLNVRPRLSTFPVRQAKAPATGVFPRTSAITSEKPHHATSGMAAPRTWPRTSRQALRQPYQAAAWRDRAGPAERGDERVAGLAGAGEPGDV